MLLVRFFKEKCEMKQRNGRGNKETTAALESDEKEVSSMLCKSCSKCLIVPALI